METWRIMREKGIGLNNRSCLFMMQALCKGGYMEEAYDLIHFLREKSGMNPSLAMCNSFLEACSEIYSITHANRCLDLMERRMLGKNEDTYTALLKLAVIQRNLSAVHEIWKDYIKYYSPSILSLQQFVLSFVSLRDTNSACQMLQHMVDLVLRGNIFIESTAYGKLYSSRLDIPIPSKDELGLQRFYLKEINELSVPSRVDAYASGIECSTISNTGKKIEFVGTVALKNIESIPAIKVLRSSFGNVMHACAKEENFRIAEQLMLQMQNLGLQPSEGTYCNFIRAIISERGTSEGMEVLKIMQQKKLRPKCKTLAVLSMACCKELELDLAEALLDQISNYQDPRPYNFFFRACDAMDKPERAVRILAKMKQLKVKPNSWTYAHLFSLFGNVNAPYEDGNMLSQVDSAKRINAIEMDMEKNGVQHSQLSIKFLLRALSAEGMIRELIQYLHMAEDLFSRRNISLGTPIYNIVLHSLVEAKDSRSAIKIFKKMKSSGFDLNYATYTTMIDCCSIIRCYKSACALVSMMVHDGFYPNTAAYTALIKVVLEDDNFDEALNLLDHARSGGVKPDVLSYNTVLRKAYLKRRIDIIEHIVELMHREKIKPDGATCNFVFCTYVECDFHNTAIEALQVLSLRMICEDDNSFQEKKEEFENNFILSDDQDVESRILEMFGGHQETTAVALLHLRWSAILRFPICWSPNETLWARRLSVNYDARKSIV
ncbi:pentatricopeptide repeat-containing protein At1g76280 isoform X2 [Jatropha curcas]|nr:pentatricopeptide repeat-containing protein At1g76280 isoform X2 [Jatropha curcas]XP_020533462.1 pentatricopeptide repeat-containing protein At1g76280 isoform X2 [Jatropha curcas]